MPIAETPKRLGVDDFAFKKGRNYGTILVDLDQRKPIDLLPDREPKTLEEWLNARPGIELVTRDRSSVYAAAVTSAALMRFSRPGRCQSLAFIKKLIRDRGAVFRWSTLSDPGSSTGY